MTRPYIGVTLIYVVTAILMFVCGFFSLGTFPLLAFGPLLGTALMVTVSAFVIYNVIGYAVCLPLGIKSPGLALPTILGTISGALAIALTDFFFPSVVISNGWMAAIPFAFVNTLGVWGASFVTGFVGKNQSFWPVFR